MNNLKPTFPCGTCVGNGWEGWVPASGDGSNGVLIVAEAPGAEEAVHGVPLIGSAGEYLWNALKRVGIERDGFTVHNVLSCRPPDNKLVKMPYEFQVINKCAPLLDATIEKAREVAKANNKTFVIVALGRTAFKRVLGLDDYSPIMKKDYLCYPFWSEPYGAWVIGAQHPSYLMRGNHNETPMLQFVFTRALEIASKGLTLDGGTYLLDPSPSVFESWIDGFMRHFRDNPDSTYLSYDIETPMKQDMDEEEVSKEEDLDYTILRCSFSYKEGEAVSVPWSIGYMRGFEALFGSGAPLIGWNNINYDSPRVSAQVKCAGAQIDAMLGWHVLNSALRKGLGFVAPFYAQNISMWKHLSNDQPAYYNARDSDVALRCWNGIERDLKSNGLWEMFHRHIIQAGKVFSYMSSKGVVLDQEMRNEAEIGLTTTLRGIEESIDKAIPLEAKALKVYKKVPKDLEGLVRYEGTLDHKVCPKCGAIDVKADHFKSVGVKKLNTCLVCGKSRKLHCDLDEPGLDHDSGCDLYHHEFKGVTENPCVGSKSVKETLPTTLWAEPLDFKISQKSLLRYQKIKGHAPIIDRKKKTPIFDEPAIERLMKRYPKDTLYPLVLDLRSTQKLRSTYIGITQEDGTIQGGMPIGRDGRIHTTFTRNPSTLRSASQNPNLQNLPRPQGVDDPYTVIRNLIRAEDGHILTARDYSGIEAVLVGYFAMAKNYIRLAKMDVHSFYTAYAIHELDGRIKGGDLPLLSWDDAKLASHLAGIKKEFKSERNELYKHLVHGANFMQSPKGASEKIFRETKKEFPIKTVSRVMDIYFELFPEIKSWHLSVMLQAEKDGFLRNPFGYIHRFSKVFEYEKIGGKWQKHPGPQANQVIAFLPQSTAAGIIVEAMLRLYENRFEEAGQYLRLLIHDELFLETPESMVEEIDRVVKEEMERPIQELILPESFGMGPYLGILTESKQGLRWGGMH